MGGVLQALRLMKVKGLNPNIFLQEKAVEPINNPKGKLRR
jgi:hypothetical protein